MAKYCQVNLCLGEKYLKKNSFASLKVFFKFFPYSMVPNYTWKFFSFYVYLKIIKIKKFLKRQSLEVYMMEFQHINLNNFFTPLRKKKCDG